MTSLNKQNFEANKSQYSGTVNFLGSSYSGVDIKLLAHIYTSTSMKDKLESQRDDYNKAASILEELDRSLSTPAGTTDNLSDAYMGPIYSASNRINTELKNEILKSEIVQKLNPLFSLPNTYQSTNKPYTNSMMAALPIVSTLYKEYKKIADDINIRLKPNSNLGTSVNIELGDLQTISVSTYREKNAVRACGVSHVKGYTRGPRTIAGSMIFTVFEQHPLRRLVSAMAAYGSIPDPMFSTELTFLMPDQLPPIDITAVFANEYGNLSKFTLLGVEFMSDGVTYSIEDIMTEEVVQFVARDLEIMSPVGKVKMDLGSGSIQEQIEVMPGSKLLTDNQEYQAYLERLGLKRRLSNR